jgi:D-alanine-D-alanine ligase
MSLGEISHVIVAHTEVDAAADASTADVLEQAALFAEGLRALDLPFEIESVPAAQAWRALAPAPGLVVCNLLEAPPGKPHLHAAATAVLELLGLPFTGSAAGPLWLSTDKIATRALLAVHGLPVAAGGPLDGADARVLDTVPPPWILKPAWEDASVGLEGEPVCATRAQALARAAKLTARFPGQPILVEHFLPGREFNVSLLECEGALTVLPVAEIAFVDFPPDVPALVTYEAKWDTGSDADLRTVRGFPGPADEPLLARIRPLALRAGEVCGVSGYARVDLRLDERGEPMILEVNTNPCLSADAGFMAAARQAGLAPADVVRRLLEAAVRLHHKGETQ